MANPGDSQDAFGIGNLIDQFKERGREVVRQANAGLNEQARKAQEFVRGKQDEVRQFARQGLEQIDRGLEPMHLQQVDRYIQEKQDKVRQHQRELGARIQKSFQELGAQLRRKDAGQEFLKTDGTNVFRPVFDAAHAAYEATPLDQVQEMIEDGKKAVEHRAGEALKEGVKQANENFRKGLRQAGPSLEALDRNIGEFDRGVHQIAPGAPHLKEISHAIDQQRLRNRQAVHEFLMRDDLPDWASRGLQSTSKFIEEKGGHAKYYAEASGLATTAGYVQDLDLLHSVGEGGLKMAQVLQKPESREAFRKLLTRPPDHWEAAKTLMADIRESRTGEAAQAGSAAHAGAPRLQAHRPKVPVTPEFHAQQVVNAQLVEQAARMERLEDAGKAVPHAGPQDPGLPRANPTAPGAAGAAGAEEEFTRLPKDRAEWQARRDQELQRFETLRGESAAPAAARPEEIAARRADSERRMAEQAGKEYGWFDPYGLRNPSEVGMAQSAAEVLRGVNPQGGMSNCMSDLMAVYDRYHGVNPTVALPHPIVERRAFLNTELDVLKREFQSDFREVRGVKDVENQLQGRETGLLWGRNPGGSERLIKVRKEDGNLAFYDQKGGAPVSLQEVGGMSGHKFMPTRPLLWSTGRKMWIWPFSRLTFRAIGAQSTVRTIWPAPSAKKAAPGSCGSPVRTAAPT